MGWEEAYDPAVGAYYVDHNTSEYASHLRDVSLERCTAFLSPPTGRRPETLTCFLSPPSESTQLEDPRVQWQREQECMLRDYLSVVRDALSAQKEIYQVKEQRLHLAQEEYRQLNEAWRDKSTSQSSCGSQEQTEQRSRCRGPSLTLPLCCYGPTVNSRSSSSSKYDPDILKAEIATAKSRVGLLGPSSMG